MAIHCLSIIEGMSQRCVHAIHVIKLGIEITTVRRLT